MNAEVVSPVAHTLLPRTREAWRNQRPSKTSAAAPDAAKIRQRRRSMGLGTAHDATPRGRAVRGWAKPSGCYTYGLPKRIGAKRDSLARSAEGFKGGDCSPPCSMKTTRRSQCPDIRNG